MTVFNGDESVLVCGDGADVKGSLDFPKLLAVVAIDCSAFRAESAALTSSGFWSVCGPPTEPVFRSVNLDGDKLF